MESFSDGIVVAFLTICIMLALCINVLKSSFNQLRSAKIEANTPVKDTGANREKTSVYPYYVDYSRNIDPHQKYSPTA